jgi:WD40 repeat protein
MRIKIAAVCALALALGSGALRADDKPRCRTVGADCDGILSLAYSPDGRTLAVGTAANAIVLFDTGDDPVAPRRLEGHVGKVRAVAFSSDGQYVASASGDRTLRLWSVSAGSLVRTFEGHEGECDGIAVSPDRQMIVSTGRDGTVRIWDSTTGALKKTIDRHSDAPDQIAFSSDGRKCAFGTLAQGACLWDTLSNGVTMLTANAEVNFVAFSKDGKTLATSGRKTRTVTLWSTDSGTKTGEFAPDEDDPVRSIAFSPDGKTLATGSAGHIIRLWDVTGPTLVKKWEGAAGEVTSLAFSPDGKRLAAASATTPGVILWDVSGS